MVTKFQRKKNSRITNGTNLTNAIATQLILFSFLSSLLYPQLTALSYSYSDTYTFYFMA